MKSIFTTLSVILLFLSNFAFSQPMGYYNGTENLQGDQLKKAIHEIIKGHVDFSYNRAADIINYSDADLANPNNVILFYLQQSRDASLYGTGGNFINREHVWAKSHGNFSGIRPMDSDAHNLRPADASVNEARGNKDFDNVQPSGIMYYETTDCWFTDYAWEPGPAVKGQVARILFYMATRYEGDDGEINLELVDKINTYPLPEHGKLSTLLQWNNQYPPSDFERRRNERIFEIQQNRNPFVDNPEFANLIWNGKSINPIQFSELKMNPNKPFTSDKVSISLKVVAEAEPDSVLLYWGNTFDSQQNKTLLSRNLEQYSTEIGFSNFQAGETVYFLVKAFVGNQTSIIMGSYIFPKVVKENEITKISNIQGQSLNSPMVGQKVTVIGRVTANFDNTLYIQDNSSIRSGVCIYNSLKTGNIGDSIVATGTVTEYSTLTELTDIEYFYNFGNNKIIYPIAINSSQINEDYEGMLVKIEDAAFNTGGVIIQDANTSYPFYDEWGQSVLFSSYNSRLVGERLPAERTSIVGIVSEYQNTYQILAREIKDLAIETGTTDFQKIQSEIQIYPNPARSNISINTGFRLISISIYTINGDLKLMKNGTEKQINISNLSVGIYFIKIQTEANDCIIKKLIVQ